MKKILSIFMLLVAFTTGAWAETKIFSEDFSGTTYNVTWGGTSAGGISPSVNDGVLTVANGSQSGDRSAYVAFGSNAYAGSCHLTFDMGMTKSGWSGKNNYFYVLPSATTARYPSTTDAALAITQDSNGAITIAGESVGTYNGTMLTYDLYLNTVTGFAKVIVKNGNTTIKTISYETTATGINTFNLQFNKNYGAFAIDNISFYSLVVPAFTLTSTSVTPSVGESEYVTVSDIVGVISVESDNESVATASYNDGTITINGIASGVANIIVTGTNDNLKITKTIEATVGEVASTTVTINYLCGEEAIAEPKIITDVVIGSILTASDVTYENILYGTGCRYANPILDQPLPYTVVENGVINITYTQQNTVASLDVNATVNEANYKIKTINLDSKYVGDAVKISYPEYYLLNGVLYQTSNNKYSGGYYRGDYTLTGNDNQSIAYGTTAATNVVYYSEAEAISGGLSSTAGNADIRCSEGTGAYFSEATDVITLSAGAYTIYSQVWGNTGATIAFTAGDKTIHSHATVGYLEQTSSSFILAEETTIQVSGGNSTKVLDLVYIVRNGDAVVSGTLPESGIGTLASAYALDFSDVEGVEAYIITSVGTGADSKKHAYCTKVTKVPANTGIILVGESKAVYSIPVVASAAPLSETNLLAAAVEETQIEAGSAIIKDGMFHEIENASNIPAGKAYLPVANVSGARTISLSFGEITGVSEVAAEAKAVAVSKFIKNGQLVIEKNGKVFNANGAQVK